MRPRNDYRHQQPRAIAIAATRKNMLPSLIWQAGLGLLACSLLAALLV